nr:hypothetical protein [Tanacetum cinerariifolium]
MKKLPIKSLAQFRFVSKAWMSLIDSVKFIADYDNVCRPRHLIIIDRPDSSRYYYCQTLDDETFPRCNFTPNPTMGHKLTSALREPILQRECPHSLMNSTLVGSSHGLLCIDSYERSKVIILNPSIRKSIAIDVPSQPYTFFYYTTVVGFGVCPLTLDPKIIMIPHYNKKDSTFRLSRVEVIKVFSLSSRAWRRPSINLPRANMTLETPKVVIDGFIYHLAFDYSQKGYVFNLIISFDLTSEEFREIHLLESIKLGKLSISKLRETLVVLEYNMVVASGMPLCAVWMMDNDSFTQL